MSLKDTVKHLKTLLEEVSHDLTKADNGNKAAAQRVRTGTIRLEKMAKVYRKESIKTEKNGGVKKSKTQKSSKASSKVSKSLPKKPKMAAKQTATKPVASKASKAKPGMKKRATAKILKKK